MIVEGESLNFDIFQASAECSPEVLYNALEVSNSLVRTGERRVSSL